MSSSKSASPSMKSPNAATEESSPPKKKAKKSSSAEKKGESEQGQVKKPLNAFFMFRAKVQPKIVKENPESRMADLVRPFICDLIY